MKIVGTIQARMGSSRLPGKTLAPILGRPMLERMIERLRRIPQLDEIVIATTDQPRDAAIAELARWLEVGCSRGSSDDVLDRVLNAARAHQADVIVEFTGDCPLIDPDISLQVIDHYLEYDFDYVSNTIQRDNYTRGLDTQVFATDVLAQVATLTNDPADHEHVSLYIYEHPERFKLGCYLPPVMQRPDLRLTVDVDEDLELVRGIYERLYPENPNFTFEQVVELIKNEPTLRALNAHVRQKPVHALASR